MIRPNPAKNKVRRRLFEEIGALSSADRDRLMRDLSQRPSWFPSWCITARTQAEQLVINDRFGPVEKRILTELAQDDSIGMPEETLLCRVWPEDAPRILAKGTAAQKRRLRQRLLVRYPKINEKLRKEDELWEIVRTRRSDESVSYYLGER